MPRNPKRSFCCVKSLERSFCQGACGRILRNFGCPGILRSLWVDFLESWPPEFVLRRFWVGFSAFKPLETSDILFPVNLGRFPVILGEFSAFQPLKIPRNSIFRQSEPFLYDFRSFLSVPVPENPQNWIFRDSEPFSSLQRWISVPSPPAPLPQIVSDYRFTVSLSVPESIIYSFCHYIVIILLSVLCVFAVALNKIWGGEWERSGEQKKRKIWVKVAWLRTWIEHKKPAIELAESNRQMD